MRRVAFRLRHLQQFLDGERIWALFVRFVIPQLVFFNELQSPVKKRPSLDPWHLKYGQALTTFYHSGTKIGGYSALEMYRGLVAGSATTIAGYTGGRWERTGLTFRLVIIMDNSQLSFWEYPKWWECAISSRQTLRVTDKCCTVRQACPGKRRVTKRSVYFCSVSRFWWLGRLYRTSAVMYGTDLSVSRVMTTKPLFRQAKQFS